MTTLYNQDDLRMEVDEDSVTLYLYDIKRIEMTRYEFEKLMEAYDGNVKIGDKVRVVDNTTSHGLEVGSVVTVVETYINVVGVTDGICKYYLSPDEYEANAPALIVVGGEYTSNNGNKWKCIFVDGDFAWLAPEGLRSAAYVFKTDGTNISQGGGDYNIKFAPVVETVNVKGSINKRGNSGKFITFHELKGDHKFNMTVDFIDGKPDWSSAKVTAA